MKRGWFSSKRVDGDAFKRGGVSRGEKRQVQKSSKGFIACRRGINHSRTTRGRDYPWGNGAMGRGLRTIKN